MFRYLDYLHQFLFLLPVLTLVMLTGPVLHIWYISVKYWLIDWQRYLIQKEAFEMQMRRLNKQAWHRITKYSQPDCQKTKNVTHKWAVGVSGPHKLSHGKEDGPCFSTSQPSKIQSGSSIRTLHSWINRGYNGKHAALIN